jgi:K+-transporting ATPase ATPase C chain
MNPIGVVPEENGGGIRAAGGLALATLLLFGFLYSLAGAGLGRLLFPHQATGSLVGQGDRIVGSALVAQPFADDGYFHPRPSAANYDPMAAAGSNQARSNPDLRKRIAEARAAVAARDGIAPGDVPGDLLTESGSGLDPDITPAGARVQAARVAKARGLDPAVVERLLAAHVRGSRFGLGEPRVNVLELNLALDAVAARPPASPGAQ